MHKYLSAAFKSPVLKKLWFQNVFSCCITWPARLHSPENKLLRLLYPPFLYSLELKTLLGSSERNMTRRRNEAV
jgi:hypothetical protein